MMVFISAFFFLLLLFILWLLLICPADTTPEQTEPFLGHAFALRGLNGMSEQAPENSMAAFRAAISRGYGITLDVRLSADDEVIVFHDEDLRRLCGIEAETDSLTFARLHQLCISQTEETVPGLSDVLKLISGQVPLMIILAHTRNDRLLTTKVLTMLKDYGGPCCVGSFEPNILRMVRHGDPKRLRIQFAGKEGSFRSFFRRHLLCNWISRPHFIAYERTQLRECSYRAAVRLLHATPIVWTVNNQEDFYSLFDQGIDIQIFENFLPPALLTEGDDSTDLEGSETQNGEQSGTTADP